MAKYRGGIIGLGWTGMLYDMAGRIPDRFEIDDVDRPTPELDVHRVFHYYENPGQEWVPSSAAEALKDRPEIDLVAAADRDTKRLDAFTQRYGIDNVYTDAMEMLRKEKLDVVVVTTNTKDRADLVSAAVENGAKGIVTEKPMCHSLEQAGPYGEGLRGCGCRTIVRLDNHYSPIVCPCQGPRGGRGHR